MLEDNIKYSATDVTQAFYLIQNRLFDYITNGDINELVNQDLNINSKCIHLPYWKLWEMREIVHLQTELLRFEPLCHNARKTTPL